MNEQNRDFKGIWIPKEIYLDPNLNWTEKITLIEIDSLDGEDGCFASNEHFAKHLMISKDRAGKIINKLVQEGYVARKIIYKEGTKQIKKRILHSTIGYSRKQPGRIVANNDTPIVKNNQDNNTINNNTINNNISKDICSTNVQRTISAWNKLNLTKLNSLKPGTKRYDSLRARIKQYGIESILKAINNIESSSFLKGQNKNNWIITFDWFVRPNNFIKVLEGNYNQDNKTTFANQNETSSTSIVIDQNKLESL